MNIAKLFSREVHQGVIDEQAPTAGFRLEQLLDLRNCQIIGFTFHTFCQFDLIIISFLNLNTTTKMQNPMHHYGSALQLDRSVQLTCRSSEKT